MTNLLLSNFLRLLKSKLLWVTFSLMALFAALMCIWQYTPYSFLYASSIDLEEIFLPIFLLIPVMLAYFVSLYIGADYDYGTIKNKLIVGCSRVKIYLANFITCAVSGIFILLGYAIVAFTAGVPLFGFFSSDAKTIMLYLFVEICMMLSFTALFTLIAMLNQNKGTVMAITLISVFATLIFSLYMLSMLEEPKYVYMPDYSDEFLPLIERPNPDYLSGVPRIICQFVIDFMPTGQVSQILSEADEHLWIMPFYSLVITFASTAAGVFFFKKKDIK